MAIYYFCIGKGNAISRFYAFLCLHVGFADLYTWKVGCADIPSTEIRLSSKNGRQHKAGVTTT